MQQKLTALIRSVPKKSRHLKVYHELDPTITPRRRRRSSGGSTGCSASATSPTPPTRRDSGYPQLSAEYIVAANPDIVVLADSICCGQTAATVAERPGWSGIAAVQQQASRRDRRQHRLALGPAHRRLRARGRGSREAQSGWRSSRSGRRTAPRFARAGISRLGAVRGGVPRRLAPRRPRRRARSGIGPGGIVDRRSRTCRSCTSLVARAACRRRSSGSCERRGSCCGARRRACSRSRASAYQGVFRNPLADPYLLGVAAGAGLGATLAIAYGVGAGTGQLVPVAAFVGGRRCGRLRVRARPLGRRRARDRRARPRRRHRGGVPHRACRPSCSSSAPTRCATSTLGMLGGFSTASLARRRCRGAVHRRQLARPAPAPPRARRAERSGTTKPRASASTSAACGCSSRGGDAGTAAAVSVSGLIGFVGIIVPHTIRLLVSTSYGAVVPLSLVVGGGVPRAHRRDRPHGARPAELPIGVITAFFGAPFFAVVLRSSRMLR